MGFYTYYRKIAKKIPSIGFGGRANEDALINYASQVPENGNILEFGPFLGSSTAFLACGVLKSGRKNVTICSVDNWVINESYQRQLKKHHIEMEIGHNFRSEFFDNLKPFPVKIIISDISKEEIRWGLIANHFMSDEKIHLVVDDSDNHKIPTDHMFQNLSPYFTPNVTIIMLLDFFWGKVKKLRDLDYQVDFMEANKEVFQLIECIPAPSLGAAFLYKGGKINYEVKQP